MSQGSINQPKPLKGSNAPFFYFHNPNERIITLNTLTNTSINNFKHLLPKNHAQAAAYINKDYLAVAREYPLHRRNFTKHVSWHVPSQSLIDALNNGEKWISVCSGLGFTESLAQKEGADIICTDLEPHIDAYTDILAMDAEAAVHYYNDRNVFMAWPPYSDPTAYKVAKAMKAGTGIKLLYIGEGHWGCTADHDFHEYTSFDGDFTEAGHDIEIPRWPGIHDNAFLLEKLA